MVGAGKIYLVLYVIGGIFIVTGYIIMRLKHGKDHKKVLDKEYEGFYSGVGADFFRKIFTVLYLAFFALIVAGIIYYYVSKP